MKRSGAGRTTTGVLCILTAAATMSLPAATTAGASVSAAPVAFGAPGAYFSGYGAGALDGGDVDGDGLGDLVLTAQREYESSSPDNGVYVLRGRAGTGLSEPDFIATGVTPVSLVVRDLDDDGHDDIATADPDGPVVDPFGSTTVLLADGRGGFEPARQFDSGRFPLDIDAADVDGDGDPDLVTVSGVYQTAAQATVTVLLNERPRFVRSADLIPPSPGRVADRARHPEHR